MNKNGYIIIWDWRFFAIIGIIILISWVYTLDYPEIITGESNPNFMFFPSSNVSYSFSPENLCSEDRAKRIHDAFNIIESQTNKIILFEYDNIYEGDIVINCYTSSYEGEFEENIAGEGGPLYYGGEGEIISGEIHLYPNLEDDIWCKSYPSTELHEILHVFGFDHFYDNDSIMFEGHGEELIIYEDDQIYVCQEIDFEIVDCLKNIYSNGVNGSSCGELESLCFARFCPTRLTLNP